MVVIINENVCFSISLSASIA